MNRSVLALVPVFLLLLTGCDVGDWDDGQRYKEDFHFTYDLKPGGRLSLENFNGPVEISGWDREVVDITGTKHAGSMQALNGLKIDVVPSSDSIRVRTLRSGGAHGGAGAHYVIRLPRRTELDRIQSSNGRVSVQDLEGRVTLRTSNGGVNVTGLHGDLDAETSNGRIEAGDVAGLMRVRTSNGGIHLTGAIGRLEAETSNGGVEVNMETPPKENFDISTSNGSIILRMPAALAARLSAHTSNGSVVSDFELTVQKLGDRNHVEGTIGSGGPILRLGTSNGSIRLLKKT